MAPAASTVKRIAYQGEPGAYSHLACTQAYPEYQPVAYETFRDAFDAVADGEASLAMIPIENSLGGRVADIHHLLPESSLFIIGEHFLPVQHCLLGPKGSSIESLKRVESHPQALAQTREMLKELGLEGVQVADTAGAARDIAERGDITTGAIASSLAAEVYDLEVLRTRIEDRLGNTTRFVVMSRRREEPDLFEGPTITSLFFQVRSVPAALYKALSGFATAGVNITKLESYIIDSSFTVAQFYAEIDGHPADKDVAQALEELQFFSSTFRILGTYPQHPFRRG